MSDLISAPDISTVGGLDGTSVFPVTDSSGLTLYKTTGAEIEAAYGGGGGGGGNWWFDPPTTAVFTPFQDTAPTEVVDDADAGLIIYQPVAAVDAPVGAFKAIPVPASDWTATCRFEAFVNGYPIEMTSYANRSLVVTDSAKQKAAWWGLDNRATVHYMHTRADNGVFDGFEVLRGMTGYPNWFRYVYNHTTGILTYQISSSGKRWVTVGTKDVKTYLGQDPQFIGFLATSSTSIMGAEMVVENYTDTM